MMNAELHHIVKTATDDIPGVIGRLIFGSYSTTSADENSDVDTLVLTAYGSRKQETRIYGHYELDLEILSEEVLTAQLDVKKWNDNVPLLALRSGIIIDDDATGTLQKLKEKAEDLWISGIADLSEQDCMLLLAGVNKALQAARKLTMRMVKSSSTYDTASLSLQLCAVHLSLSAIYLRSNLCWVYAPWVVAKLTDPRYSELAGINQSIFEAGDPLAKLEGFTELADRARAAIKFRLPR